MPDGSRRAEPDQAARPRPALPSGQHVICCRTRRLRNRRNEWCSLIDLERTLPRSGPSRLTGLEIRCNPQSGSTPQRVDGALQILSIMMYGRKLDFGNTL
jgi:hypothetical protein